MKDFKLKLIFVFERDKCFKSKQTFRGAMVRKYKLNEEDIGKLYCMIVNYQVKKYGYNLSSRFYDSEVRK